MTVQPARRLALLVLPERGFPAQWGPRGGRGRGQSVCRCRRPRMRLKRPARPTRRVGSAKQPPRVASSAAGLSSGPVRSRGRSRRDSSSQRDQTRQVRLIDAERSHDSRTSKPRCSRCAAKMARSIKDRSRRSPFSLPCAITSSASVSGRTIDRHWPTRDRCLQPTVAIEQLDTGPMYPDGAGEIGTC